MKIVYKADDGRIFDDEETCLKYEGKLNEQKAEDAKRSYNGLVELLLDSSLRTGRTMIYYDDVNDVITYKKMEPGDYRVKDDTTEKISFFVWGPIKLEEVIREIKENLEEKRIDANYYKYDEDFHRYQKEFAELVKKRKELFK